MTPLTLDLPCCPPAAQSRSLGHVRLRANHQLVEMHVRHEVGFQDPASFSRRSVSRCSLRISNRFRRSTYISPSKRSCSTRSAYTR